MAPSHPNTLSMVLPPCCGETPSRFLDVGAWACSFQSNFDTQFGLFGLLTFAIPSALGLLAFGWLRTHRPTRGGSEVSRPIFQDLVPAVSSRFSLPALAITLTIFAFIRYVWQPLGYQPWALYLLDLANRAGRIRVTWRGVRYHPHPAIATEVMAVILLVAVCWLLLTAISVGPGEVRFPRLPTNDLAYWGYAIPICIGFLVGPWLDLQQWQRAIQDAPRGEFP